MPEQGKGQPRDDKGRFIAKAGDQIRENPETGELEIKIKVNGQEQYKPLHEAQELTQKGAHYTTVMQEARKLQKEYKEKLQSLQSGGSGVNQDLPYQNRGPAPGSGVGPASGGQYPGGLSLNPADIPDPIDAPEKYKQYMAQIQSRLSRLNDLEREIYGIKSQQAQFSNQIGREQDHKYLEATIPGYDKQEVEDELTRIEADPDEDVKQYDHRYGMELLFRRIQDRKNSGGVPPASGQAPRPAQPQRNTPYQESSRNAPPASSSGSAPQGPAETSRQAEERYLQYNKMHARSGG